MTNALIDAIENDDFEQAYKLIERNENNIINEPDQEGNYPLHLVTNYALYSPALSMPIKKILRELAFMLIDAGANPNCQDTFGSYPIHYVTINGDIELFKKMVEFGADYNILDAAKETPLHQAIRRKHDAIVEFLMSKDLLFESTVEGQSPIDYAERYNFVIMQMIEDKFADHTRNMAKIKLH